MTADGAGPGRAPTVHDVARAAGVSASTVSRALHGRGYASPEVRAAVVEAARSIGYVANANARSLRARTSQAIGVLLSDLRNAYYAELAAGIEAELAGVGLHMMLVNDDGDVEKEIAAVASFAALRVAGVIVTPVSERIVRELTERGMPMVCADRRAGRRLTDVVMSDNRAGGRTLTSHLIERGHRRIAIVLDEQRWSSGAGRLAGYYDALSEAGIEPDDAIVRLTHRDADAARDTTHELLRSHPDITAVVAINNVLAQGAFTALRTAGIRIGADVALAAFDEVAWMPMVQPGVTTLDQRPFEIGRRAAALLLRRIGADGVRATPVEDLVTPSLLVRQSTVARSAKIGRGRQDG